MLNDIAFNKALLKLRAQLPYQHLLHVHYLAYRRWWRKTNR